MDMEALLEFLDGSEQLELYLESSLEEVDSSLSFQDRLSPEPSSGPKGGAPRSKKVTSSQRRRNERALLLSKIEKLQQDLKCMQNTSLQRLVHESVNGLRLQNLQLRRLHARERSRAETVATLLKQLASVKVLSCSDVTPQLCIDSTRDAAIFRTLDRNLDEQNERLVHSYRQGLLPVSSKEGIETVVSLDGSTISSTVVRFMPFEVMAISDSVWRNRPTQSNASCSRMVYKKDANVLAMKEEFRKEAATLRVHKIMKRFLHEHHTVFQWEAVYEWSTVANPDTSTTSQESGWVLLQPVNSDCGPISASQSFMKMSSCNDKTAWMQLTRKPDVAAQAIGPSYQQIMLDRLQFVENRLVDEAMHGPL